MTHSALFSRWHITAVAITFFTITGSSYAGKLSLTGAELAGHPNVFFPNTVPTISGDALVFGSGVVAFEKLIVLPLIPEGTGPTSVTVSMNFTRLVNDNDPLVALGDGSILIGAQFSDNAEVFADRLTDQGTFGNRVAHIAFGPFVQPAIGESFDVSVTFDLEATTTLNVDGSSFEENVQPLDTAQAINFVFMRDNDVGEQYQINSLEIETEGRIARPSGLRMADPSLFAAGTDVSSTYPGMELSTAQGSMTLIDLDISDPLHLISDITTPVFSTGTYFSHSGGDIWSAGQCCGGDQVLRMDFKKTTKEIAVLFDPDDTDTGVLQIYDKKGRLLGEAVDRQSVPFTLSLATPGRPIAYALATFGDTGRISTISYRQPPRPNSN